VSLWADAAKGSRGSKESGEPARQQAVEEHGREASEKITRQIPAGEAVNPFALAAGERASDEAAADNQMPWAGVGRGPWYAVFGQARE
jgi:hypothetical protein